MVGKTVHQYQFLEKLGAGGMGEIYKAQDTRLNRIVAIKVLTSASAGDPERRRRFIQEAQAASALNHPNIITIHDIITEGDSDCMVMEYVQGKTLVDLIPKGGLRVPQVLKCALQMTDALQAAHAAGIIHRDLKPGNVMVTDSGLVKILDFGLAKLADRAPMSYADDATRTIADAPLTVEGSIIGTVSYMSPEQAQGKKVDPRSDIFSLGVVLYEMVTGARAFTGESALSTLSSILRDEARPILEIAPDVPPVFEQVINRSLRKSPDDRFQTMREMQVALSALKRDSDSGMLYRSGLSLSSIQAPAAPPSGSRAPGSQAPGSQASQSVSKPASPARSALLLGIAGAVVVMLAAGGGVAWWIKHRNIPAPVPAPVVAQAPEPVAPPPPAEPVAANPPAEPADQTLTNDGIIQMAEGKVAPTVIMSQIRAAGKTSFNFSPAEIVRLTKAGVSENVIETMRNPKKAPSAVASSLPANPPPASSSPAKTSAAVAPAPTAPPVAVVSAPVPVPSTPPPAVHVETVLHSATLVDGWPVPITLADDIPQDAEAGRALHFVVTDDIRIGDLVVIAKGAQVTGEIVEGAKKKLFSTSKMTLRLLTVDAADGKKYRVRALSARGGDGKNERSVETNTKPKSKDLAASAGAAFLAYIDGDATVTIKK